MCAYCTERGSFLAKSGRPTKYQSEYAEQARKYCLLGATNERLAELFEVGVTTIDRWLAENDGFRGAVKAGRQEADARVASSARTPFLPPSTPASRYIGGVRCAGSEVQWHRRRLSPS